MPIVMILSVAPNQLKSKGSVTWYQPSSLFCSHMPLSIRLPVGRRRQHNNIGVTLGQQRRQHTTRGVGSAATRVCTRWRTQAAVNNVDPLVLIISLNATEANILALADLRRAARCAQSIRASQFRGAVAMTFEYVPSGASSVPMTWHAVGM